MGAIPCGCNSTSTLLYILKDNFRILSDSDETDDENEKKPANKKASSASSRQKSADNNDGRDSSNENPKSAGSRFGKESPEVIFDTCCYFKKYFKKISLLYVILEN